MRSVDIKPKDIPVNRKYLEAFILAQAYAEEVEGLHELVHPN